MSPIKPRSRSAASFASCSAVPIALSTELKDQLGREVVGAAEAHLPVDYGVDVVADDGGVAQAERAAVSGVGVAGPPCG